VNSMLKSGAVGYILKNASVDELEHIIRTINEGNTVIDTNLMQMILHSERTSSTDVSLSPRELEILKFIAGGMSYNQVANGLTISLSTVKFHVANTLTKLKVETRNEAILLAAKLGLI